MKVVILGASQNKDRVSNQAIHLLKEKGHEVTLVNPAYSEIDGMPVLNSLKDVEGPIETLTLYLSPERLAPLIQDIVAAAPQRTIFNPGTESSDLMDALDEADLAYQEDCTLVLLRSGRF